MPNNINDPQKKISDKESSVSNKIKKFPSDLSDGVSPHLTLLRIFEYTKKDILEIEKINPLGTIYLPLASGISYMDGHEWKEFDGGVIQNIADGSVVESALGLGVGVITSALESIGKGSTSKLVDVAQAEKGLTINPKRSNVYVSPKFREFQLEYTLVAKNERDSKNIKDIENILRYYSSPQNAYTAGMFLKAPAIFQVKHISSNGSSYEENQYFPKYLPAALVGINVDYNSNGDNYLHKKTFAPIDVKITLAFKELEYDTKDTLKSRYKVDEQNMWDAL